MTPAKAPSAAAWLLTLCAAISVVVSCADNGTPPTPSTPAAPVPAVAAERTTPTPAAPTPLPTRTAIPPTATPRPSPTPMPMMLPTQTPAPRPTPTALPATPIDDTRPSALADEAFAFLETFTNDHSPRASATDQELAAARALMGHLEEMGYRTSLQDFTVDRLESEVSISSDTATVPDDVASLPITLSHAGAAVGLLADAVKALPDDIPDIDLDSKVALIERGTITFEEKVRRVTEAGAVTAVVFNNQEGLFRGTLSTPSTIPVLAIDRATGLDLLGLIGRTDVEADVAVSNVSNPSRNVVAEKPGESDGDRIVIIGAHYDTVPDVAGANDNGSGTAAVMTIARQIAAREYPFTVRFILFGSEEVGLFGSRHYVSGMTETERANTIAMINLDVWDQDTHSESLATKNCQPPRWRSATGSVRQCPGPRPCLPDQAAITPRSWRPASQPSSCWPTIRPASTHPGTTLDFIDPNLVGWSAEIGIALLDRLADR